MQAQIFYVNNIKLKKVSKRILLHTLVVFISFSALPQNKIFLDSMQNVLIKTNDTAAKLNCLYTLSYEYGLMEPRKGLEYGGQCLKLAKQARNKRYQLNAYNGMGNCYETMANFDSARYCHFQSYLIAKKTGTKATIAATLFNMAGCYKEQGNYRNALNIYMDAYKLVENEQDYNPRLHYYLGEMFLKIGNVPQAEYHALLGIRKCKQWKVDHVLPNLYINLAKCKLQREQIDSAVFILENALAERKKFSDQLSLGICLNALGEAYVKQNQYDKALACFEEELSIQKKMSNQNGICLASLNSAYCCSKLNPKAEIKASKYLQETEKGMPFINHNKDVLMEAYRKLAITYELLNQNQLAFSRFKSFTAIKDSLLSNQKIHELNELQTKYATEKKEKQIQVQKVDLERQNILLQKNRLQLIALISAFSFFLLFGFFFYNRYKSKQKIHMLLEIQRQEKLRENALKEKETEERTRIAKDIHDELGSGISKLFLVSELSKELVGDNAVLAENLKTLSKTAKSLADNMKDLVWSLDPENNTLDNLIARINEFSSEFLEDFPIQALFEFSEQIPSLSISKEVQRNLFLTFKEALNNAVKHAQADAIKIVVTTTRTLLTIGIVDNGKGFEEGKIKKTGNGLRNMTQRLNAIGGVFKIESTSSGTRIFIIYPFNKELA